MSWTLVGVPNFGTKDYFFADAALEFAGGGAAGALELAGGGPDCGGFTGGGGHGKGSGAEVPEPAAVVAPPPSDAASGGGGGGSNSRSFLQHSSCSITRESYLATRSFFSFNSCSYSARVGPPNAFLINSNAIGGLSCSSYRATRTLVSESSTPLASKYFLNASFFDSLAMMTDGLGMQRRRSLRAVPSLRGTKFSLEHATLVPRNSSLFASSSSFYSSRPSR